ncbi:MAG: 5-(carboxyamino)imidazole ribonucleotide mutase [Actinobacteria bacterium]|nr:5-(carboxyamino)imidazole ribonucleotide mutase [Actinomycetota bacterium]
MSVTVPSVARVGIIMGSRSDLDTMREAADLLDEWGIGYEIRVVSAHRTPDDLLAYGRSARGRGLQVLVAGAGGAAHLPGMLAATTTLPVIGVPVALRYLDGLDSLLSMVQMPKGVPVATVAIGGAANAAILAARIIAIGDQKLEETLSAYAARMADDTRISDSKLNIATLG